VSRKNRPKCFFLWYLLQNSGDSDKIWHTISWINLLQNDINVFHLTWIMYLHYIVANLFRKRYTKFHQKCQVLWEILQKIVWSLFFWTQCTMNRKALKKWRTASRNQVSVFTYYLPPLLSAFNRKCFITQINHIIKH